MEQNNDPSPALKDLDEQAIIEAAKAHIGTNRGIIVIGVEASGQDMSLWTNIKNTEQLGDVIAQVLAQISIAVAQEKVKN